MNSRSSYGARITGREEMAALAAGAILALREAALEDELGLLETRVFGRSPECLFESLQVGADSWFWTFKPMVELLLHHVRDVASAGARSIDERRREIRWAIEASGF
jgi:hypothetical protein